MKKGLGTALVTGASSGIGAVYADRLAARGHELLLVARRRERLERLASELESRHGRRIQVVVADLAQAADVERVEGLIAEQPGLSCLVNCAGSGALGAASGVDGAAVAQMLQVNVVALTRLSIAAARRFASAQAGSIINIGSVLAWMPVAGAGSYSGSKAYVLNFSRALHSELDGAGVGVQVVMPGPVRSEFFGPGPAPFPERLFMSAETLVDTALAAFDQGELVTYPNLENLESWQALEQARSSLVQGLTQSGLAASRYHH